MYAHFVDTISSLIIVKAYRTNDLLRDKLHLHLGQIVELTDRVKELESEKRDLLNQIVIRQEEQASNEKIGKCITFDKIPNITVLYLGSKIEDLADRLVKREEEFEFVTASAVTLKAELRIAESRYSPSKFLMPSMFIVSGFLI